MEWEVVVILLVFISGSAAQLFEFCPAPWISFEDRCYKFVSIPTTLSIADGKCQKDGASLVSVNSQGEHDFIVERLKAFKKEFNIMQSWYTSGRRSTGTEDISFFWEGDGSKISSYQFWVDENARKGSGERIVYTQPNDEAWGWVLRSPTQDFSYICEISKTETYKILEESRGFGYGIPEMDRTKWKRGPEMDLQPKDVIYDTDTEDPDGKDNKVALECVAVGNPSPSYEWFKDTKSKENPIRKVDPSVDSRYTLINGRLLINNPKQNVDYGDYFCTARNEFGAILSNTAALSFGYLNDFSKATREPVSVDEYQYVGIDCKAPQHYPEVYYSWYKDSIYNFIRSETKPWTFISNSGKLLFSYVTEDDAGDYYCMVFSPKQSNTASEGKVSMPIQLKVSKAGGSTKEPDIASGFPSVFPSSPKKGDDVRIECFSWGTGDLVYSWFKVTTRDGKTTEKMPDKVTSQNHGRVLLIPDIELNDGGYYKCSVRRINGLTAHGIVYLPVDALPYFRIPLEHQHLDVDQDLTWRCQADGRPAVTYSWYRNTVLLTPDTIPVEDKDRVFVQNNVLTIKNVNPKKDSAMYQCGAKNLHGQRFSAAQLRVMSFKPTFAKYPLQPNQFGTIRGNVTIRCTPEAAPRATTAWKKDGRLISPSTDDTARVRLLPNGNLFIHSVQTSDGGMYTCVATNDLGEAESAGRLTVLSSTTIEQPPKTTVVEVNKTALFECQASYNPALDLTYVWYHNKYKINFNFRPDPHYEMGKGINRGGLFVKNAQPWHAGVYICVAETTSDSISAKADLHVIGPPGQPGGVKGEAETRTTVTLKWKDGKDNGRSILSYVVEGWNKYDQYWSIVQGKVLGGAADEKRTTITDLSPNINYRFRIRAENVLGTGRPSHQSDVYTTLMDVPKRYPSEIGGGGGKVGTLTISWQPLPEKEWNGNEFRYEVNWRESASDSNTDWEDEIVKGGTSNQHIETVGQANFYRLYEIRVRAVNSVGPGPWSSIITIRSAMSIPVGIVKQVRADPYNSTALEVSWDIIEDTILNMKGVLGGYRINYWKEEGENENMALRKTVDGQVNSALIIGLDINSYYLVNVNVWNRAGNGPKSQDYEEETLRNAPLEYPTEIEVIPYDETSIIVKWRGVSTNQEEEPLQGYMVRYWRRGETIYNAKNVDAEKETRIRVTDLEDDTVYSLRVLGYSLGGDGAMSRTLQFTIGQNCRTLDTVVNKAIDKDYVYKCNSCHIQMSIYLLAMLLASHLLARFL